LAVRLTPTDLCIAQTQLHGDSKERSREDTERVGKPYGTNLELLLLLSPFTTDGWIRRLLVDAIEGIDAKVLINIKKCEKSIVVLCRAAANTLYAYKDETDDDGYAFRRVGNDTGARFDCKEK
jgi:hypothetical protein